jgi:cytochrome c553
MRMRAKQNVYIYWLSGCLLLAAMCAAVGMGQEKETAAVSQEQAAFFEKRVRPLLYNRCFSCHGDKQQQGGLRLDSLAAMLKGNASGPAVVPGKPEESLLVHVIRYDHRVKMPPTGKLANDEISTLVEWVKMGAPWPGANPGVSGRSAVRKGEMVITEANRRFWAFRPIRKPAPPSVKNVGWVKSPIDRFILAKLEEKGLTPAPPAERRALLRRVYFDLIGLPPRPEEVQAFVADRSPDALAKVVDRLLASPHYGERWARHWLDVARYADSNGLDENLAFGNAWRYRDYVVKSFNQDKPYNQFILEQLAGDLMPAESDDQRNERLIATGFLSLGPKVLAEQDKPKLVMDIVDEQIEVTSKAFMGLTVACARCHDHKFDPISMKDYYALAGIFKSTRTMRDLGFVSRVHERPLVTQAFRQEQADYEKRLAAAQERLKVVKERGNAELAAQLQGDRERLICAGWELAQQPPVVSLAERAMQSGAPARIVIEAEKYDRGNVNRDFVTYGQGIGVIHSPGTPPDFAEWDVNLPQSGVYQIELRYAAAESRPVRLLLNSRLIRDSAAGQVTGSWQPEGQRWEAQGRFRLQAGKNTLRIERDSYIPHFDKILLVPLSATETPVRTVEEIAGEHGVSVGLAQLAAKRIREGKFETLEAVREAWSRNPALGALPDKPEEYYSDTVRDEYKKAEAALKEIQSKAPTPPMALAVEEGTVEDVRIHLRGSTLTLGDRVPRRFLTVIAGEAQPPLPKSSSGRLELARWMASSTHPLTSRVLVNRVWQIYFGQGLVRTPDNFGLLGERPTHPELLDWLAATFMQQGWSLKRLHKTIILSSAYQMSVANSPKVQKIDPDNRLLWRMNRRRLQAEAVRDAILSVSGQLDPSIGGSLLTTPNHDYVTNDQSGNGAGYNSLRRSIYLPIIRNALYDMFQTFDMGDPSTVNAQRATTIVASQALYLMNSPFVLEQSRHFAQSLLDKVEMDDPARLRAAYLRALGRSPSAAETSRLLDYLKRYEAALAEREPDVAKRRLASWQSLCQILFASNEFIYLN